MVIKGYQQRVISVLVDPKNPEWVQVTLLYPPGDIASEWKQKTIRFTVMEWAEIRQFTGADHAQV